jgi:aspartokinase
VVSSSPAGVKLSAREVCSLLAHNKINITLLAHLSSDERAEDGTALCTEEAVGHAAASLIDLHHSRGGGVAIHESVSTLSIFVHEQQPRVAGAMLEALARKNIPLLALASSPAAVSSVVSFANTEEAISALFEAFDFPSYSSPSDWYAAYEGKEHLLHKIIATYQEQVIKIYDIVQEPQADLWTLALSFSDVGKLGKVLTTLDRSGLKMLFIAGLPLSQTQLGFAFCFAGAEPGEIEHALSCHLSTATLSHQPQIVALFIHGPHFGDRYGIASTLLGALQRAGVSILALSCTVSSISAIIREADVEPAMEALNQTFQRG